MAKLPKVIVAHMKLIVLSLCYVSWMGHLSNRFAFYLFNPDELHELYSMAAIS